MNPRLNALVICEPTALISSACFSGSHCDSAFASLSIPMLHWCESGGCRSLSAASFYCVLPQHHTYLVYKMSASVLTQLDVVLWLLILLLASVSGRVICFNESGHQSTTKEMSSEMKKKQKKKQVFVKAKLCTNSRWTSLLTLLMSEWYDQMIMWQPGCHWHSLNGNGTWLFHH